MQNQATVWPMELEECSPEWQTIQVSTPTKPWSKFSKMQCFINAEVTSHKMNDLSKRGNLV